MTDWEGLRGRIKEDEELRERVLKLLQVEALKLGVDSEPLVQSALGDAELIVKDASESVSLCPSLTDAEVDFRREKDVNKKQVLIKRYLIRGAIRRLAAELEGGSSVAADEGPGPLSTGPAVPEASGEDYVELVKKLDSTLSKLEGCEKGREELTEKLNVAEERIKELEARLKNSEERVSRAGAGELEEKLAHAEKQLQKYQSFFEARKIDNYMKIIKITIENKRTSVQEVTEILKVTPRSSLRYLANLVKIGFFKKVYRGMYQIARDYESDVSDEQIREDLLAAMAREKMFY